MCKSRIILAAVHDDQTYDQYDQHRTEPEESEPRHHLRKGNRITDLSFDIMGYECRRIHRHCLDFQTHRIKDESIEHPVRSHSSDHDLRKFIQSLFE